MTKTDMRLNCPQCRQITYCSSLAKERKEKGSTALQELNIYLSVTLPLQIPGACAQTCFQQQVEAHCIKEKISCASQIKARMLLFKFPFNLLMLDKRKKQDSSHRYATVPKMRTEQQRFKTGTKMKTISICRLSMSSTNTEPVSEKENACGKEPLSALCGFNPYLPPCQASEEQDGPSSSYKNVDTTTGPGTTKYLLISFSKHLTLSSCICYRTVTLSIQ